MNKEQRKKLEELKEQISNLSLEIEEIKTEEEYKQSNLEDNNLDQSPIHERLMQGIEGLENVISSLNEAEEYLEEIIQG